MTRILPSFVRLALGVALLAPSLEAQRPGGRFPREGAAPGLERRAQAEQALRETFARTVKERLALTDEQATRLQEVNRRFSEDRLSLVREEFRLRRELRRALAGGGDSTRAPGTEALLDGLLDIQRRRLEVQQREQQALAEFLTPVQRARYLALQEQLRRRVQARLDSARDGAPVRGGPPPF